MAELGEKIEAMEKRIKDLEKQIKNKSQKPKSDKRGELVAACLLGFGLILIDAYLDTNN